MRATSTAYQPLLRYGLFLVLLFCSIFLHTPNAFAGLGPNLIVNPSLENGTTTPNNWQGIKSGVASVTFTYPVAGIVGEKAAQIAASAYTSGDEYWQPPTASVSAGQQYQFTGYSKSTVPVSVIATYVKSGGARTFANLGTAPGTNAWQKFTAAVTIPTGVVSVRIQHVLQAVGVLAVDSYSLQLVTADTAPPTCTIAASPSSITAGSPATLTFSSSNANGGTINNGVGTVGVSGTKEVRPTGTTLYTATFTGTGGATGTCSTTVTVATATAKPVISSFTATPTTITQGQSSTLAWSVSGATSLAINGQIATGTSKVVTPSTTASYVLTATNDGGSVTATQSVTVTSAPTPAPTCSLTGNPTSIQAGNTTTLTLTSTNSTSGSTNFGMVGTSGSWSLSPTTTTTYTASVSGPGGAANCSVSVNVTAAPAGNNLIANGNFETSDPNSASTPANWSMSVWDATATFSYPVAGNNGGKAAKVTATSVNTAAFGGAIWASAQVQATSSIIYQYTNDYSANVETNVSVEFVHKNGSLSYHWLNQPAATGTAWAHQVINITVPTDVVSFTVIHGISSVGSLTLDNVSLVAMPPTPFATGMVTLTFDDGLASQYKTALPMLTAAALPATFAIITSYPAALDPNYMSWADIQKLKAAGFEIAAHTRTHPSLTELTSTQAQQEISGAVSDLVAQNLGPTTFVYPYGAENTAVEKMVKDTGIMIGARGSYVGLNAPFSNRYAAYDIRLEATTQLATVKQHIDQAIANKRWLILELHDVMVGGNEYAITPTMMQDVINYIKSSGIRAVTLDQGMRMLNP